jgi:hypothetical protein
MATIKDKILAALDCALDDIAEDRLLDILLDAYAAKKAEIERLHGENAREREQLHQELEAAHLDRHRMRSDPLYCAAGAYYFLLGGTDYYAVHIQGTQITLLRRLANHDQLAQPISRDEYSRS